MRVLSLFLITSLLFCQTPDNPPSGQQNPSAVRVPVNPPVGNSLPVQTSQGPDISVTVNKSVVLEHADALRRISVSSGDIAEALAISSNEVLINGKSQGETTLMLWDVKGARSTYDVHVISSDSRVEAVRSELNREAGPDVTMTVEGTNVFLRGTVKDAVTAERAYNIASTLGRVVNLLRVTVPKGDPQILLKVRFANVSRSATQQLGINLFSANPKGISSTSTNQFGGPPTFNVTQGSSSVNFSDLLNIFYFRPDLNIGAFIEDLEAKSLVQVLAEPNLLTLSGHQASFLAGGEFPFPTLQGGGSGVGQITVQFKEFGIRLSFLPSVTPRGTIQLAVTPEVSSLDYSNGLTVNGFTVPGLASRRVQTQIELEDGQSFVIAGLLDNQVTQQLNKLPGIGDIPVLGKLFQSRSLAKNDDELMVIITPELVLPIPAGTPTPQLNMPLPFLKEGASNAPRNPGPKVTGVAPPLTRVDSIPVEQILTPPGSDRETESNSAAIPQSGPPGQAPPIFPATAAAPSR